MARPLAKTFALSQEHPHAAALAALATFRVTLAEQHRLGEELTALRKSLHTSVEILRTTISHHADTQEKFMQTSSRFENSHAKAELSSGQLYAWTVVSSMALAEPPLRA